VTVASLVRRYGERTALDGVTFSVSPGELFCLLGPNGGGKTTLFRILATLLPPTSGTAHLFGHDVTAEPASVRASLGVVFQSPSLDKKLRVRENLRHSGHLYGLSGRDLRDRMDSALAALRLEDRAGDMVEDLSGGLQRRVEIAKCLLIRPRLLLLDEPSTGLDPAARIDLWEVVTRLRAEENMTVLFTTHLLEEAERASRVGILSAGKLVALDAPRKLREGIGGDVLSLSARDPASLAPRIAAHFGVEAEILGDAIRIESPDAHGLAARVAAEFRDELLSVTVARPTLEDVFIARTGRRFAAGGVGE